MSESNSQQIQKGTITKLFEDYFESDHFVVDNNKISFEIFEIRFDVLVGVNSYKNVQALIKFIREINLNKEIAYKILWRCLDIMGFRKTSDATDHVSNINKYVINIRELYAELIIKCGLLTDAINNLPVGMHYPYRVTTTKPFEQHIKKIIELQKDFNALTKNSGNQGDVLEKFNKIEKPSGQSRQIPLLVRAALKDIINLLNENMKQTDKIGEKHSWKDKDDTYHKRSSEYAYEILLYFGEDLKSPKNLLKLARI